jgi:hypothetical protein
VFAHKTIESRYFGNYIGASRNVGAAPAKRSRYMNARFFAVLLVMAALCGLTPLASGSASALTVAPSPLNFGNAIILPPNAASKHGIVTLTNNLGASVTILSITSDHPEFVPDQTCVKLLTPHEICGFTVTFTPSATGPISATLTMAKSGAALHVKLEGFGKRGKIAINPDPVGFGKLYVQAPIVRTVTLLNNNPVQMTLSGLSFSDSHFSETDDCAGTIAAYGSCHVWINLKAASPGPLTGVTMNVSDNAAGSPQHVPLGGSVLALPACAAGASGTFTSTTTHMFAAWRIYHTASTLKTGKVLIVGGTGNALTQHAELYNFKTCKFELPGKDTPNSRQGHTATLLANGKVLIAGGEVETATTHNVAATAEIFVPSAHGGAGAFFPTGSMHFAREFHTATLLANGKVLIAGGTVGGTGLTQGEIYDPATGKFTLTGAMSFPRFDHTATLLSNGEVLIAGGTPNGGIIYSSAEIFDPAANHGVGQFSLLGNSMSFARIYSGAALLTIGSDTGDVLIAGGYGTSLDTPDTADLFETGNNPLSGSFGTPVNSMSTGRESPTVTRLLDGSVLVAGGSCDGSASGGQPSADLLMVTGPDLGKFDAGGTMLDGLVNHAAALLPDGQVLVTGGWQFNPLSCANPCVNSSGCQSSATNHAELYHP